MLSSFLSPFSQAKFHSALCVKRGEPADHRPERESDRREESADRCEAEQSGRTRRTEKGDTALFRSSAGRVLTRRRAVSCQRTRRKGRRSRASSTISLHARAWCSHASTSRTPRRNFSALGNIFPHFEFSPKKSRVRAILCDLCALYAVFHGAPYACGGASNRSTYR